MIISADVAIAVSYLVYKGRTAPGKLISVCNISKVIVPLKCRIAVRGSLRHILIDPMQSLAHADVATAAMDRHTT